MSRHDTRGPLCRGRRRSGSFRRFFYSDSVDATCRIALLIPLVSRHSVLGTKEWVGLAGSGMRDKRIGRLDLLRIGEGGAGKRSRDILDLFHLFVGLRQELDTPRPSELPLVRVSVGSTYHHSEGRVEDQVGQGTTEHLVFGIVMAPLQPRHLHHETLVVSSAHG